MTVVSGVDVAPEETIGPFLTAFAEAVASRGQRTLAEREEFDRWAKRADAVLDWVLVHFDDALLRGRPPQVAGRRAVERFTAWIEASLDDLSAGVGWDGGLAEGFGKERACWDKLGEESVRAAIQDSTAIDRHLTLFLAMAKEVAEKGYGGLFARRWGRCSG